MPNHCPECLTEFEGSVRFCPEHGARLVDGQAPSDPFVGHVLEDRFRLEDPIGSGGMGNVYRATQLSVDRDVAIKLLRTAATLDGESRDRFMREAKVISDFTHPNIVRLIDFGWEDDSQIPYLVMELIDGTDLGELMRGHRLDARIAVEIARQVCTGLIEAHAANVIHRDLKPDNILLVPVSDGSFQAKLVDFGIALPTDTSKRLTSTGMICGTPHYIAPEQASGRQVVPATDLYSLGIILFEMLAGVLPFWAEHEFDLLVKHTDEPPPPLSTYVDESEVPKRLINLVDQLLRKDPTSRPESALALRKRLDAVASELPGPAVELDPTADPAAAFDPWRSPVDASEVDTRPDRKPAPAAAADTEQEQHNISPPSGTTDTLATQIEQQAAAGSFLEDNRNLVGLGLALAGVTALLGVAVFALSFGDDPAAESQPPAEEANAVATKPVGETPAGAADQPTDREPSVAGAQPDAGGDDVEAEHPSKPNPEDEPSPEANDDGAPKQAADEANPQAVDDSPRPSDEPTAQPPADKGGSGGPPDHAAAHGRNKNRGSGAKKPSRSNNAGKKDDELDQKIEKSQEWLTDDW